MIIICNNLNQYNINLIINLLNNFIKVKRSHNYKKQIKNNKNNKNKAKNLNKFKQ